MEENRGRLKVFALKSANGYAESVAFQLSTKLAAHEEYMHADGESYMRALENVRRARVFVIADLYSDEHCNVDQKIVKLAWFVGALRDASADDITVVAPYLPYARADRKVKSREGVATKYLARMLTTVGTDRMLTMDVHSLGAFQNAYQEARVDNLEAKNLLAEHMAKELHGVSPKDVAVFSPDPGGVVRAKKFRRALTRLIGDGVRIAFYDKERDGKEVSGECVVGSLAQHVIVVDDMIATGKSISQTFKPINDRGGERIYLAATHGLFVGDANCYLNSPLLKRIVVTDSIRPFRLSDELKQKTSVINTTALFATAIRHTYTGQSLSRLFE